MKEEIYDIIEFTPADKHYYGDSVEMPDILLEDELRVKASEVDIPLGHSRYGGPVADLPKGFIPPEDMCFAAQLDLKEIAPFDKSGLLPKTGHLFFFADIFNETGKVIYADVNNNELVRVINDHEDNFYEGVLIDKIFASTESLSSRYRDPEFDEEKEDANKDGKIWEYFAGTNRSKIFGIYTHCQLQEEEILDILHSNKILLLQIGENGFNDDGVFSVLIDKNELKNKNFDNCSFAWGQS